MARVTTVVNRDGQTRTKQLSDHFDRSVVENQVELLAEGVDANRV
jgi:hypothetical protein